MIIEFDGTFGPHDPLMGPDYTIPAEAGEQHGNNLFHSFEQFNLHRGESATFTGPDSVDNVVGRVTGGEPSMINGALRSDIPGANIFLLNPQGILFGPDASLDVLGSFHASTAHQLRFADGATFAVGRDSTLTTAPPAAFGFEPGSVPKAIHVDGSHLEVPEGETLSLIGGDLIIRGDVLSDVDEFPTLYAPGGRIHLVSAASSGEVEFGPDGLQVDTVGAFGTITITDAALLSVSGENGGTVLIRGGDLIVDRSNIFADTLGDRDGAEVGIDIEVTRTFDHKHGGFITADSFGAGHAGDIRIAANLLRLDDEAQIVSGAFASGNASDITVEAANVILTAGARIDSTTVDLGQGGRVIVRASETVILDGSINQGVIPSGILADTLGEGNAGSVLVEAQTVMLTGGATISSTTLGPGRGGAVTVRASGAVILSGTSPDGSFPSSISANSVGFEGQESGDGGRILVEASRVEITGGAVINSETTNTGQGGMITVRATDEVVVSGVDENGLSSAIAARTLSSGDRAGDGGAIRVEAQTVTLSDGGRMISSSGGPGGGGTITVVATGTFRVEGMESGLMGASFGRGQGGDILVNAHDIHLTDGALISSRSMGTGDAGTIALRAEDTFLSEQSLVTTGAVRADGGNIRVTAGKLIRLHDSQVTATVGEGEGAGGNIDLNAGLIALLDSGIRANAFGGPGGNITITADAFLADPTSSVTASSALNVDGDVEIRALVADLSGVVTSLPQDYVQATALIPQRCAARRRFSPVSSFVLAGRDSTPVAPDGALSSPLAPERWGAGLSQGLNAYQRGDFEQAISRWMEAAQRYQPGRQPLEHSAAQAYLGRAYQALGQVTKAIQHLQAGLALARVAGDRLQIAVVLAGLGDAFAVTGPVHIAEQHFQHAHELALALDDMGLAASIENHLGNLRTSQSQPQKALALYLKSVEHAQQANQPTLAAYAKANAAAAALQARQYAGAAVQLSEAAKLMQRVDPAHGTAYGLLKIGRVYDELRQHLPERRREFLRQALDAFNTAADMARELDDARALAYAWGYLGQLYEHEGRYEEARELTRRALTAAGRVYAPESRYRWQWQAARLLYAQGHMEKSLEHYRRAVATVQSIRHELPYSYGQPPASFRHTTGQLYFEFVDLILRRAATLQDRARIERDLKEARRTVEQFKAAELQDYFRDDCVDAARAQVKPLDAVAQTAIVVYPILLPNRLELLVSLPSGLQRFGVPVSAQTVTQEVRELRAKLEKRTTWAFLPHAQRLYDWLIRPLEPTLSEIELQTLVFVPDGSLLTIPMAVLHDGEQFLIRKYAIAVTPGLDLTDPRPLQRPNLRILAMGLTKGVQGFPSLPFVENELQVLTNLYNGGTMLDEAFRLQNLEREVRKQPFNMVHIASHGQFSSDVKQSFLLTFDDKLTLDRLDQLVSSFQFRDNPLELLTLSACQTATGDDRAALGLAGIAIKAGARSALATLWFINDKSSTILQYLRQNGSEARRLNSV